MIIKPKSLLVFFLIGLLLSFACLGVSEREAQRLNERALSAIQTAMELAEDIAQAEDLEQVEDLTEELQYELEAAIDNIEEAIEAEEEFAESMPIIDPYFAYPATGRTEEDQPEQQLIEIIAGLDKGDRLEIAMYAFTDKDLRSAVKQAAEKGVKVRLFLETDYINRQQKEAPTLKEIWGSGPVKIRVERPPSYLMHNKYAIIDGRMVITGSYNWSDAADLKHWENLLVIQDQGTVAEYSRDFANLWNNYSTPFSE